MMVEQTSIFDQQPAVPNCGECGHSMDLHKGPEGRCTYATCICGLRDAKRSEAAKEVGMARVVNSKTATDEWKTVVIEAIRQVAERQPELSSVDVVELLTRWNEAPAYGSRVMGPLMRKAAKEGIITGPARVRKSDRVTSHSGLENVWDSMVYQGERRAG